MPSYWLLKTEPAVYSYADLERAGTTTWDGVSNHLALKHLRAMRPGDEVLIYHTGKERQIVGVAVVAGAPYPDPSAGDHRLVVVALRAKRRLARPISLAEIKADKAFADFALVRLGRLSVMPVSAVHWQRLGTLWKRIC